MQLAAQYCLHPLFEAGRSMNLIWYLQAGIGTGWGGEGARICIEYFTNIDDPFFQIRYLCINMPVQDFNKFQII